MDAPSSARIATASLALAPARSSPVLALGAYPAIGLDSFLVNPAPFLWFADQARRLVQQRRRVRVLVHRAMFLGNPTWYYFVKVTNLSHDREVVIEHAWFDTNPRFDIITDAYGKPLPARLRLDETWEAAVPVSALPSTPNVERLARVRLSNGKIVKSRLNRHVPPTGTVARAGSG